jgi:hypothetical protein
MVPAAVWPGEIHFTASKPGLPYGPNSPHSRQIDTYLRKIVVLNYHLGDIMKRQYLNLAVCALLSFGGLIAARFR